MHHIEQQANALNNSASEAMGTFDWNKAMTPDSDECKNYNIAAKVIVEPKFETMKGSEEAANLFVDIMENDPDNWINFIRNTLDDGLEGNWTRLAKLVKEYGY